MQNDLDTLLNFFQSSSIDRMAHMREDRGWLEERFIDGDTRFIPVWRERNLFSGGDDSQFYGVCPTLSDLKSAYPKQGTDNKKHLDDYIFLGKNKETGIFYFAVELPSDDQSVADGFSPLGEFYNLRMVNPGMGYEEVMLMMLARAMVYWRTGHRFCGECGSPSEPGQGGHVMNCSNDSCGRQHFPRTDPAVIALIHDGERCLLGRQAGWPKTLYSTLAGFVEPGETLEHAVTREVFEESGVKVEEKNVVYFASQPWSFPSSLMLGFIAETTNQEINRDTDELEEARWFSREEIDAGLENGSFKLPSRYSIARRLILEWYNKGK